jgi:hypothetical protein
VKNYLTDVEIAGVNLFNNIRKTAINALGPLGHVLNMLIAIKNGGNVDASSGAGLGAALGNAIEGNNQGVNTSNGNGNSGNKNNGNKGNGDKTIQDTTKTLTELQQNESAIQKLVEEYQKLATEAKIADDVQKSGIAERQTAIRGEIGTLQARNEELKRFADEAKGIPAKVGVKVQMVQGISIQNNAGLSELISGLKKDLDTADFGSELYKGLSEQLADASMLQTLVSESLKAGLGTAMFDVSDELGRDFWTRAMEGSVEDTDWQAIADMINEKRKEIGLEPIELDFTLGKLASKSSGIANLGENISKSWNNAASSISSIGSALNQIDDPSVRVAGLVASAIATIAQTFAKSLTGTMSPWDWIAAAISGTATMISTIAAIKSATASSYEHGGIVPGNSWTGDHLTAQVNSGELILSRSQQNNLASQLSSPIYGETAYPRIMLTGDKLFVAINNYLKATNKGQLVTSK